MAGDAKTIDQIQIEIQASSTKASSSLDQLTASLGRLKNSVSAKLNLSSFSTQVEKIGLDFGKLSPRVQKAVNDIAKAKSALAGLGEKKSFTTEGVKEQIDALSASLKKAQSPFMSTKEKVKQLAASFSELPPSAQKAINANAKLEASNKKTGKSFSLLSVAAKLTVAYLAVKRVASVIGDWIKESNDYVENLNLFTVAMGKYAESAKEYAETVGEAMGIDPSEWMRNQGIFMTLLTGFGNAADRAAIMSKNLTQLGYDLSSFFNITFADAMQKLQSGVAGELEPLRRLGYDLSQARLQAIALSLGIDRAVSSMTQAEKSQLRYYAIMTQVTTAQGDMARTLQAPANQLRILQSMATQAARALGNIFIPALNAILPYAIAFLKIVRMVAQSLAELFGFSMPEIDYSGLEGVAAGGEDAEDALGGAAGAAKKLKGMLAGFDEINVITQPNAGGGGGGGGVGGIGGGDLGLALPEYDFLGGAIESQVDKIMASLEPAIEWLKKNIDTIWGMIVDIGIVMLAWKIEKSVVNGISSFLELAKNFPKLAKAAKVAAGLLIAIAGVKWSYEGGFAIGQGQAEFMDYVKAILGPIAAGVGGALIGSSLLPGIGTAVGFAIGLTIGVLMELKGIIDGQEAARVVGNFTDSMKNANIPIEEFANAAANAFKEIGGVSHIVAGYGQVILDENAKIDEAKTKIETYMGTWQATGEITTTKIGAIIEQLGLLLTASQTKLSAAADALNTTLVAALKNATDETANTYNGLLDMIYLLESNGNTTIAGWKSELAKAEAELRNLDETSSTYQTDAAALMGQISDLTTKIYGLSDSSLDTTGKLEDLNAAVHGIDFSNLNDSSGTAQQALTDLTTIATTAYTDARAAYQGQMDSLDTLFSYIDTSSPQWKAIYDKALDLGLDPSTAFGDTEAVKTFMQGYFTEIYNEEVKQIDALFKDTYGVIAKSLAGVVEAAASETWQGKQAAMGEDWWARYIYGDHYEAIDYINNPEAQARVKEKMSEMWSEGIESAATTLKNDDAIGPIFTALETSISSVESARALTGAGASMGESLTGGFSEGLTSPVSQAFARLGLNKLAGLIDEFGLDAIGAHSPADLTIPHGEYLAEGIAYGLTDANSLTSIKAGMSGVAKAFTDNKYLVTNAFKSVLNDMLDLMERFTSKIANALNGMLSDFASTMKSMSISANGTVSYNRMSGVSISGFAAGGYPVPGELFFARESGPEMVGSVNGRTAVANNDQIVEAVSQGVYRAVSGAMSGQQGSGDVYVYIGGEQIDAMVTRAQGRSAIRSNGRSL